MDPPRMVALTEGLWKYMAPPRMVALTEGLWKYMDPPRMVALTEGLWKYMDPPRMVALNKGLWKYMDPPRMVALTKGLWNYMAPPRMVALTKGLWKYMAPPRMVALTKGLWKFIAPLHTRPNTVLGMQLLQLLCLLVGNCFKSQLRGNTLSFKLSGRELYMRLIIKTSYFGDRNRFFLNMVCERNIDNGTKKQGCIHHDDPLPI